MKLGGNTLPAGKVLDRVSLGLFSIYRLHCFYVVLPKPQGVGAGFLEARLLRSVGTRRDLTTSLRPSTCSRTMSTEQLIAQLVIIITSRWVWYSFR